MMPYPNKYDVIFPINMPYPNKYDVIFPINMSYSNKYDAIPICRTHGACVNTPNFDALSLPVRSHSNWWKKLRYYSSLITPTTYFNVIF